MIKGKDQIIFNILAYVLVGLFAVACLLPFYLIVTGSLTDESTIVKEGYSFFLTAKNISTEAYKLALKNPQSIIHAYGVTIFVTIIGTVLSIIMTTMTGYVLSRPDFPWRNGVSFFFFFRRAAPVSFAHRGSFPCPAVFVRKEFCHVCPAASLSARSVLRPALHLLQPKNLSRHAGDL